MSVKEVGLELLLLQRLLANRAEVVRLWIGEGCNTNFCIDLIFNLVGLSDEEVRVRLQMGCLGGGGWRGRGAHQLRPWTCSHL